MGMRDCGSKRSVCRHQGGMESILDRVKEENGFHFDQVPGALPVVIARHYYEPVVGPRSRVNQYEEVLGYS
jgi:hypothetical protein